MYQAVFPKRPGNEASTYCTILVYTCFSHERGNVECKLSGKPEIFGLRTMQTPVSYIDIGLQVSSTAGDNKLISVTSLKNKVMMKEVIV